MRNLLAIVLLLIGAGCVARAYTGPQREKSEVALLEGGQVLYEKQGTSWKRLTTRIVRVDGRTVVWATTTATGPKPAPLPRVEVLPGKHIVTIEWVRSKLNEEPYFSVSNAGGVVRTERTYTFLERGEMSIELNVEGGHRYVLVPSKTRNGEPLIEPAVSTRQNLRDLLGR